MKRIISVLAVMAIMAAMAAVMAVPAFADAGGVPNDNACPGQTNRAMNARGVQPPDAAETLFGPEANAGDWNKFVREVVC